MTECDTTHLTVIRHGETLWNTEGRQQGHLNSDLSELGLRQARAVADALAGEHFDALYSSDLGRAVQTAETIAQRSGLDVITDARLRERHLGIMQGLTIAEFQQKHPEEHTRFRAGDPDYALPHGESSRQRHDRNVACLNDVVQRHPGQRLLIVAHGGVLDSLFRHTLGIPIAAPRRFSLFNAAVNTFTVTHAQCRLHTWGNIHHLEGMGTLDDF